MVSPLTYGSQYLKYLHYYASLHGLTLDCCIAGGAVRDTLLETPVKDIDIFYAFSYTISNTKTKRKEFHEHFKTLFKGQKLNQIMKVGQMVSYNATNVPIISILEVEKEPYPVQFIQTKPSTREIPFGVGVCSTFDFSICQAYYTIEQGIKTLPTFEAATERQELRQLLVNRTETSLLKRIIRLKKKFPDYELILHDDLQNAESIRQQVEEALV